MWPAARVVVRFGPRWPLVVSFLISTVGLLLLSGVAPDDSYLVGVQPGMLVTSIGCGLSLPALTGTAVAGTTEENAGLDSAVFSSVQQVGRRDRCGGTHRSGHTPQRRPDRPVTGRDRSLSFGLTIAATFLVLGAVLIAALALDSHLSCSRMVVSRTYSYADAVKLLGAKENRVLAALDRIVGGALLSGVTMGLSDLLGWFDAKVDFARLSHELLVKAGERRSGLSRYGQTEQAEAAPATGAGAVLTALAMTLLARQTLSRLNTG